MIWFAYCSLNSYTGHILLRLVSDIINESVDLIAFLCNIEANKKFYHRHIVDISESRASLTGG